MQNEENKTGIIQSSELMDTLIRFSVIAFLALVCIRIFAPFTAIMVWGLMLAIMLYPLHQMLARRMSGKQGRASTLIVLVGLLLIIFTTLQLIQIITMY